MANIVELRGMSGDKLAEMRENAREELFNLRFQKATARLESTARLQEVRREIAQLETVLRMRQLAKEIAAEHPDVAQALEGKDWQTTARFDYVESAWVVSFMDEDRNDIATVLVDLNKKGIHSNRKIRHKLNQPSPVISYEIAG